MREREPGGGVGVGGGGLPSPAAPSCCSCCSSPPLPPSGLSLLLLLLLSPSPPRPKKNLDRRIHRPPKFRSALIGRGEGERERARCVAVATMARGGLVDLHLLQLWQRREGLLPSRRSEHCCTPGEAVPHSEQRPRIHSYSTNAAQKGVELEASPSNSYWTCSIDPPPSHRGWPEL